tara:strand:- start:8615 stop:9145 length:531 start_codon:yes stop_codon:yes gene_type:complete
MGSYCSNADVAGRLGLDSGQRDRASTRLTTAIRRAAIDIDQMFREYGTDVPSAATASSTTSGALSAGATTITVASGTDFSSSGNGNVAGDSFKWTGKSTNDLTGVTGLSFDHDTGATVQQGEFAHVLREICGDLAAAYYLEDEAAFHDSPASPRVNVLRSRGEENLQRLAHLGSVD